MERLQHSLDAYRQHDVLSFSVYTSDLAKRTEGYNDLTFISSVEMAKPGDDGFCVCYHIEILNNSETVYERTVCDKGQGMPDNWVNDMIQEANQAIDFVQQGTEAADLQKYMELNNAMNKLKMDWARRKDSTLKKKQTRAVYGSQL